MTIRYSSDHIRSGNFNFYNIILSMNKLYLLAALALSAYAVATETEADACDIEFTEQEDGDYAYTWSLELPASDGADLTLADGTTVVTIAACYNDFIYNGSIDEADCDMGGDACTTNDGTTDIFGMYVYPADGENEDDVDFESVTLLIEETYETAIAETDTLDAVVDEGVVEAGSDIFSLSESNGEDEGAMAAGYRVFFMWMAVDESATTESYIVTGESNNAVFSAASALTVAAVAGLFF
jgi:hypothetical protein